jgi:hypothetical protein
LCQVLFLSCRSASLRDGLRHKEGSFFYSYPALIPQRAQRASGTHWANFVTRLTALDFGAIALHRYLGSIAQGMSCYLSREPKAGEDAVSNPTLAAKLKNRSELRGKNGAPTFLVEERKSRCSARPAVLPQRLKPGNVWQFTADINVCSTPVRDSVLCVMVW